MFGNTTSVFNSLRNRVRKHVRRRRAGFFTPMPARGILQSRVTPRRGARVLRRPVPCRITGNIISVFRVVSVSRGSTSLLLRVNHATGVNRRIFRLPAVRRPNRKVFRNFILRVLRRGGPLRSGGGLLQRLLRRHHLTRIGLTTTKPDRLGGENRLVRNTRRGTKQIKPVCLHTVTLIANFTNTETKFGKLINRGAATLVGPRGLEFVTPANRRRGTK